MSGQADIVKKDNLKLKVVRSKTAGAAALQGVRCTLSLSLSLSPSLSSLAPHTRLTRQSLQ